MIRILRTNSGNQDFIGLVNLLDADLAQKDGNEHSFYSQFNKIDSIKNAVVIYENDLPIGCGAIKEYSTNSMEVKRMYTMPESRGKGIATIVLNELEKWATELGYQKCLLETGKKQPEAIALYKKNEYELIANYGQYAGIENSLCFEKQMNLRESQVTNRITPIEMSKDEFRKNGYQLVDTISNFFETIGEKQVTPGETPEQLQEMLGTASLPENGVAASGLISKATELLMNHSLLNGHPKFFGYITSSPAPIGALADLLAAAVNPNVGAQILSPIATEIEKQTVRWLAEFIGVSPNYGGILVSGGNMANFTAFLAARTAKAPKNIKEDGISNSEQKLVVYCSKTTHTWIEKAAVLFGLGTRSIRWIPTNEDNRMDNTILEQTIKQDLKNGCKPIMTIGTAGDVSTGVVDDFRGIAAICKTYDLWFHIDGAYGVPAAVIPELKDMFQGIEEADSIALDPHKWLYSPLEAGCTLVKDPTHLIETYSSHPVYYNFDKDGTKTQNYYEYGFQNSRGFRALKVWLALQQVGRTGYIKMIGEDIQLSKLLFDLANDHPELEAMTQNLSITTLRYIPVNYTGDENDKEAYLNKLNEALLDELQKGGEAFLSNAMVSERYCLRACIVNFRTSKKDIEEAIEIIVKEGRKMHNLMCDV
ncbi:MAG: GNAT family N-acetyltransferase [Ferruginibacter sp.]